MRLSKCIHTAGMVTLLAGIPLTSAFAQAEKSPSTSTTPPPAATAPAQSAKPADPQAANKVNPLIGLAVFSSDGSKVGTVHSVSAAPDGKVTAIHFKTGGFLGFGAKLVAVPDGKFTRNGQNVQLGITSDEVGKLPEVKEQS